MPDIIDLSRGHPTPSLLPTSMIQGAFAQLSDGDVAAALGYGPEGGPMSLRRHLAAFLSERYRFPVSPEEVATGSGISLSLALACQLFSRTGDTVVCEDPSYYYASDMFDSAGLRMHCVPVDGDGMRVDLLERALTEDKLRPAFVYCIASFHNPTGVTLAPARAERLVALAETYDFLVIADEPYTLLHFDAEPPPCMMSYDAGRGRVLSLGSFSKILAPGLRTGWVHGHPSVVEHFTHHGSLRSGGGLNPVVFAALEKLITDGSLGRNIDHLRAVYGRRAEALTDTLRSALPGVDFHAPRGGYFLWLPLTAPDDREGGATLDERAHARGVKYMPGGRCAVASELAACVRLCFAYCEEGELRAGAERLARAIGDG
ncbi:MAG: PLP-dependent aminotransferase family protein [Haliangiales bacterium]